MLDRVWWVDFFGKPFSTRNPAHNFFYGIKNIERLFLVLLFILESAFFLMWDTICYTL
jgi:hypothetical protein